MLTVGTILVATNNQSGYNSYYIVHATSENFHTLLHCNGRGDIIRGAKSMFITNDELSKFTPSNPVEIGNKTFNL